MTASGGSGWFVGVVSVEDADKTLIQWLLHIPNEEWSTQWLAHVLSHMKTGAVVSLLSCEGGGRD